MLCQFDMYNIKLFEMHTYISKACRIPDSKVKEKALYNIYTIIICKLIFSNVIIIWF